jgi:hypothetical protein
MRAPLFGQKEIAPKYSRSARPEFSVAMACRRERLHIGHLFGTTKETEAWSLRYGGVNPQLERRMM